MSDFNRAFDLHYEDVLAYAIRRSRERSAADDAAAETFVVAWRKREQLPDPVLPWLYGVCRRVIANQNRAGGRRRRLQERLRFERVADDVDPTRSDEDSTGVLAAFARLPESSREVLRLVTWEELDIQSAAAALGCTPTAFRVRLHRARRSLRRELEADTEKTTQGCVSDVAPKEAR